VQAGIIVKEVDSSQDGKEVGSWKNKKLIDSIEKFKGWWAYEIDEND
jgi:hypothetical protein